MRRLLSFLLLLFWSLQVHALKQADVLPPDQAFQFRAEVVAPDRVKATWDIAKGYYLYRDRFEFKTETADIKLLGGSFPEAKKKDDPNLGETLVYYDQVSVEIPLERGQSANQAVAMALQAKFQGCADAGLCYPPQRKTVDLQLAAMDSAQTANAPAKLLDVLPKQAGSGKPLSAEQAFAFQMVAQDKHTLKARWKVTPGYHLYRPKIQFVVKQPQGVTLGSPVFPQGKEVNDEYFGKIEVYAEDFEVLVPIVQATGLQKLAVETTYQGCAEEAGICYPPVKQVTELDLTGLPEGEPLADAGGGAVAAGGVVDNDISQRMQDESYFSILVFFLLAGLGLALTPCVFPMIPILSGIIVGSGETSASRGFWLSLAYVLPMALTYAVVGVIAGLSGANLQVIFQTPWVIALFAGLFVLLALSMFGFYDLQMPASIQMRLAEISNRQQGGSFIGAGIMGVLSALIVGPCVTAPLIGALVYIAQTRDAVLGGLSLFMLGLGMGLPLLAIGTSAGRLLPRAGAWMDTVKAIFGIMMLGLAIWMLDRIVAPEVTMALTGVLLVTSGIYMGALERVDDEAGGWGRFWKSIGLIMMFYGGMMLFGVASGSSNLLQPLKGVFGGAGAVAVQSQPAGLAFRRIKGVEGLEQALAEAKAQNRPVMLDFYADWCVACKELEHNTFRDPAVVTALAGTLVLQADVTANDAQDQALNARFGIFGPPQVLFFKPSGEEVQAERLVGYEPPELFLQRLQRVKQK